MTRPDGRGEDGDLFFGGLESGEAPAAEAVTCLGMTFPSDEVRREYFLDRLREKLKDPEFRKTPGFPKGEDEDILRLSDPPYYTACPNPFLAEWVEEHGRPFDSNEAYHREPFAVDVSVGKTDGLYKAHGYHTKVPHLAIVPSILHYTKPDDIVLDGFCGSGLTGVAAQFCGSAPSEYRKQIEMQWKKDGRQPPQWGARRAVLGDLGPAATFIAANYNLPFGVKEFEREAKRILRVVHDELGWMYETLHTDGKTTGQINYTVWSEVFSCPECAGELIFLNEALDPETKRVRESFPCPSCRVEVTKDDLDRVFETSVDPGTGETWKRVRLEPVLVNYSVGKAKHEKSLDPSDRDVLRRVADSSFPPEVPTTAFPIEDMYHGSRLAPKGFTCVHHLFLPRQARALAALWRNATAVEDVRLRNMLLFFVEQAIWTSSLLNRFRPTGYSQVSQYLSGVYYVPSQHSELSPWYVLGGKLKALSRAFQRRHSVHSSAGISTGNCASIPIADSAIDYAFTDPPFGENIYYADLNFLVESWHRVWTDAGPEAIVDKAKKKGLLEYQGLMHRCFAEYHRVLKPGRWMTVVFSNHSNAVWRAIQEALGTAGFVVADVRTLDKQQGSYRQVTSSAVKQDLVISAYKPTTALEKKAAVETVSEESAWAFVREHLRNLPIFVATDGEGEVVAERTAQLLLDRMIAFHVQRGLAVPLSSAEFFQGLEERYPERDRMYFLPEQVAQYDRKRISVSQLKQLSLFPTDEASAIQWLRQQLHLKPQTYQDLAPTFMHESHSWAKHEESVELKTILEQNFLCYDGSGQVPSQIHSYLSTNFKDLRNLDKEDPALVEKAKGRWYVPDPAKQGDVDHIREKQLLREYEEYQSRSDKELKKVRLQVIRAGFADAWRRRDFEAIVAMGSRLPEEIVFDDSDVLAYFVSAGTLTGED